jgi:nucleotide-binding universal stress UspA family protein
MQPIMDTSFKHILVPVDASPQSIVAFRTAVFFAQTYQSALTAVHIQETSDEDGLKAKLDPHANGLSYQYMHKNGTVFREILNAAEETNASLIIMGTHGVMGFQEFWMGSNAYKVVSSSKCPVLTMRENNAANSFKTLVVPIDSSFESRQKLPVAISLAKKFGSTLHVLGVSVDKDKETEYQIAAYARQVIHTLEDEGISYVHEKSLGGNITNLTIDYAKSVNADAIIIMTEQEPQIGSFFLGKFAQQMVNHSTIPVISVAPREDLVITEAKL